MLFYALAWRRALGASASERPRKRLRLDAVPPPDLAPRPGRAVPDAEGPRTVADKIAPLTLAVSDDAPARVNVLIPTVDLEHLFGGYIAKFNLALRLAERGHRVRLVTTDPVGPLPGAWKQQVEGYAGLEGLFERVEVAFGREAAGLEASRSDRFVATAWWTAHVAHHAAESTGTDGFLYLIQEYEPVTFPMGTWAALAEQSYTFPHRALYSTDLLRDWFRERGVGAHSETDSATFENAITAVEPPSAAELERRGGRRLLFYARPEDHAARNMFELGVLGLGRALETGALGGDWELNGIGSLGAQRSDRPGRPRDAAAAAARGPGRLRADAGRARRGAGADVHAAPEPGPAGDGLGGHEHGDQPVRDEDPGAPGGDLLEPDRRRADRGGRGGGDRARRWPGPRTSRRVRRAPAWTGAATGASRSATRCWSGSRRCLADRLVRAAALLVRGPAGGGAVRPRHGGRQGALRRRPALYAPPFDPQAAPAEPQNELQFDSAYVFEPDGLEVREALREGRLPLWTRHQSAGRPLLAAQQSAPLYPLTWLGVAFPYFEAQAGSRCSSSRWPLWARRCWAGRWGSGRAAALLAGVSSGSAPT